MLHPARLADTPPMVYVELNGSVFEIDLRAPCGHAMAKLGSAWIEDGLTNEQALFDPDSHPVSKPHLVSAELALRPF